MNDLKKYFFIFILSFVITYILFSRNIEWYEVLSLSLFFFFIIKFVFDLGKDLSIKNIIAIIASMQYLLGAVLGYAYNDYMPLTYRMIVSKENYFGFVLPAVIAYFIGIYLPLGKSKNGVNFYNTLNYYRKGRLLIIIGFIAEFLPLGFFGYILAGLKFVGLFYILASKNPFKYYWTFVVFGFLILLSLNSGLFHELILWGCFFVMMYYLFKKSKIITRLSIILAGFAVIFIIQLAKLDYRNAIRARDVANISHIEIFLKTVVNKLYGTESVFSNENIANTIIRLNQGWIISNVIDYIPAHRDFANGKTISDAVIASIFPRFLFPNKPVAGGRENMENYAGVILGPGTSMDISQLGESYANFGVIGGIIMMLMLGLIFNIVIIYIEKKSLKYPELVLWIPLVFLQVIKAETSLVTILNHLVKASIVTWFFFSPWGQYLLNNFLPRRKIQSDDKPKLSTAQ